MVEEMKTVTKVQVDPSAVVGSVFRLYKKYFPQALFVGLLYALLSLIKHDDKIVSLVFTYLTLIPGIIITGSFVWFIHKREQGENINLFTAAKEIAFLFGRLIGVEILKLLIVSTGLILFIIPGITWSLMYGQAFAYVLFEKKGVFESLGASKQLTEGNKRAILNIYGMIFLPIFILSISSAWIFSSSDPLVYQRYSFIVSLFTGSWGGFMIYALWQALHGKQITK